MCQAAWLKIFKSLLDDAAFENPEEMSFKTSPTISTLSKYCACFIQYYKHTEQDINNFQFYMEEIWNHFYRWRRIYLTSTKTIDHDLIWLETMLRISVINYDESC